MSTTEEQVGRRQEAWSSPGLLGQDRDLLERVLEGMWHGPSDQLARISRYALLPAGKLLRPLLVVQSARSVGGSAADLTEVALAIECLHVATLIHDDIIDHDDVRRNRPSVPAAFGVPTAIVVGDGLILKMFAALAESRPESVSDADIVAVVRIMAAAGLNLCRGQLLESEFVGDLNCSAEQYLVMAHLKTGVLFESACRVGAILGGGQASWVSALGAFGRHLGAAFQIRDDLLGFDGGDGPIGKPRESDVANRRPTLPILLAYQSSNDRERGILDRALDEERPSGADAFADVREIVLATGARKAAGEYAAKEISLAKQHLAELPVGPSVTVLGTLADYAADRSA